jgi:hypothetical protein
MRISTAITAALVASALSAPAGAAEGPAWHGVWQGTIGTLPVRACFADKEYGSEGAYYYLRHLRAIPLEQLEKRGSAWVEQDGRDPKRPRWTFKVVGAILSGTWSDGRGSLPFRLTRMPGLKPGQPACGSLLFNQPRLKRAPIVMGQARIDGVRYTKLTFRPGPQFPDVEIVTFALDRPGPAAQRINQRLREPLRGPAERSEWFRCMRTSLAATARDGDYHVGIEPVMASGRWLAARHWQEGSCGGASPFNSTASRTFDLSSGAEVALQNWLNGRAIARGAAGPGSPAALRPAFRQFLLARAKPRDADCREAVANEEYWDIGLRRAGLRFSPSLPRVVQACGEEILVPFSRLTPYLSAQGSAGVASLR